MEYPRTITLEDDKLRKLLQEKNDLILMGRETSVEVEIKEDELAAIDKEIQAAEKKADVTEFDKQAKAITEDFNAVIARMETVKREMLAHIKATVPPELYTKYEDKVKEKEELEKKRNKIGLKVQKFNDKIIPWTRKLMRPYLEDSYEDYDSIRIENGEIVGTIFSHIEMFKENFAKKKLN